MGACVYGCVCVCVYLGVCLRPSVCLCGCSSVCLSVCNCVLYQSDIHTHVSSATSEYTSRETLIAWRNKNHKWLELTEVRRETTNGIRVTVMPFYMGARVRRRYSIRDHVIYEHLYNHQGTYYIYDHRIKLGCLVMI